MCLCVSQLIQLLSAVDPDEPVEGHHFYFSMIQEKRINPNFTIRDNQGFIQAHMILLPLWNLFSAIRGHTKICSSSQSWPNITFKDHS